MLIKLTDDKTLLLILFFLYFFIMFPLKSRAAFFQNPNGLACHHIYLNKNTAFKESPLTIQSKRQNWIQKHIFGFSLITLSEQKLIDKTLKSFWNLVKRLPPSTKIFLVPNNLDYSDISALQNYQNISFDVDMYKYITRNNISGRPLDLNHFTSGFVFETTMAIRNYSLVSHPNQYQTFAHELAHLIEVNLLTKTEIIHLKNLFNNAKKNNLFLSDYSEVNFQEYFAECMSAFVRETVTIEAHDSTDKYSYFVSKRPKLTRTNLLKKDPDMFYFIADLLKPSN